MREHMFSVTLADCEVQTFRAGGPGGQKQNKTNSGVRIIHHPSGARGESREERSQLQNKKKAFKRMAETPAFKLWVQKQLGMDDLIRCAVDRDVWPDRVKVEVKQDGKWVEQ
jgi:protein subunit release factor B